VTRHVVVSYVSQDVDFARAVAEVFSDAEFRSVDAHNANGAGESHAEVDHRIREALAIVAILSPNSIRSPHVNYDWAFALGSGIPVLPVLLEMAETELHPRLRTIQYVRFTTESGRPWHLLVQALRKLQDAQRPVTIHVPRTAPPVIQQAAHALDSMNEKEREKALETLGQMDHPSVVEVLAEAVRHPVRQVRFGAAIHLGTYRDTRAIPALLEAIRARMPDTPNWMLGNMGPAAVPALLEALHDGSDAVREAAAVQLGRIGGAEPISALMKLLRDGEPSDRHKAAYALRYSADPVMIPELLEAIHDPDRDVRRCVIGALAKCAADSDRREELQQVFIEALDDEYDQVGIAAVEGLGAQSDERAIRALVRAVLMCREQQVRAFARSALGKVGAAALPALREAAVTSDALVLYRVINLLGDYGDERDFPLFVSAAGHENRDVRDIAVSALWKKRVKDGVPVLLERLNEDDEGIRERAISALGAIGDPSAITALVECLNDPEIAEKAAGALESIGTRESRAAVKAWKRQNKT
jgi:HEAT repeat protein